MKSITDQQSLKDWLSSLIMQLSTLTLVMYLGSSPSTGDHCSLALPLPRHGEIICNTVYTCYTEYIKCTCMCVQVHTV